MPRHRCEVLFLVARDQFPRLFVEIDVEARQHDGAMRQACDRGDQFGRRRDRAGRAGGDHRRIDLARQPRGLGFDERVASFDRLHPVALVKNRRPGPACDLQEAQRELPILVVLFRHQIVEALPRHAARRHVVDQPRQIVGKRAGRRRRLGDERCAARAMKLGRRRPFSDELRQQQAPFHAAERFRQSQRVGGDVAGRGFGERDLILVDIADGDDARQDRRVVFQHSQKGVARQLASAARRQIERG